MRKGSNLFRRALELELLKSRLEELAREFPATDGRDLEFETRDLAIRAGRLSQRFFALGITGPECELGPGPPPHPGLKLEPGEPDPRD